MGLRHLSDTSFCRCWASQQTLPHITICSFYHILKVADKFRVVSLIHFSPIITWRNIRISLPNTKSKGVCPLEEWTLLWLSQIGCLTSSSCSSSVISCTLVSLFWTSSASPPPSVSDISTLWSHSPWCTNSPTWTISTKQDRYSCLPGLFTTSLGRSSLAPTSTIFFCSAYDHTRLHWLHLTRPWLYRLLVLNLTMRSIHWPPSSSVSTCFLPAFPGTPVGCSSELLEIAWNVPWLYWIRDVHDLLLYFKWSLPLSMELVCFTWFQRRSVA